MEKLFENKLVKRVILSIILALMTVFTFLIITVIKHNNMNLIENIIATNNLTYTIFTVILLIEEVVFVIGLLLALITVKDYIWALLLGFSINIVMFFISVSSKIFSLGHNIFFVINTILAVIGVIYYYIGKIKYKTNDINNDERYNERKYLNKLKLINILNIIEFIISLLIFFIPVVLYKYNEKTISCVLINGLLGSKHLYETIPCLLLIIIYVFILNRYFNLFGLYKSRSKNYLEASKRFSYLIFAFVIIFFMTGVITANIIPTVYKGKVDTASTYTHIPFLIFLPLVLAHGLAVGSAKIEDDSKPLKANRIRWTVFFFVTIFTLITFISLFLSLVSISTSKDTATSFFLPKYTITPWDLLTKSNNSSEAFSVISFFILAIVLVSGILYFLSIVSIFTKSKEAKRICLATIFMNFIFIVALGLFGKYYEISYLLTKDNIFSYLSIKYPYITLPDIENPTISSQIFFLIFADAALAILLLILKPFTKSDDELFANVNVDLLDDSIKIQIDNEEENNEIGKIDETLEELETESLEDEAIEETEPGSLEAEIEDIEDNNTPILTFDVCPSFTELDIEAEQFEEDLNYRRTKLFENPSLPALVTFIVDYARESRLHLSYTVENIAAFIAGLGSTKLAILQGMSGTGKTSLPKIFLEAIMGNCEIVEVESSWKDKNELLGYYNEFSKIYTPKKFTRALYKASLNPNVVTFIVLDEMNLSRIEYYFSDFLSLMENEPENRKIQLTNIKIYRSYTTMDQSYFGLINDHTLKVPENVWFIGTANRDESTFEISDKVYDRAYTMNFNKRAPKVRNYSSEIDKKFLEYDVFKKLLDDALDSSDFDLESVEYIKNVEEILRPYNISFGNRIMNQIEKYVKIYSACFNNDSHAKEEAIEDILLSKVIAKLEFKAIEDKDELVRKFEKLKLYKCSEFIKRLSEDF